VGQRLKSGVVPKLHVVLLHQLQYFHLKILRNHEDLLFHVLHVLLEEIVGQCLKFGVVTKISKLTSHFSESSWVNTSGQELFPSCMWYFYTSSSTFIFKYSANCIIDHVQVQCHVPRSENPLLLQRHCHRNGNSFEGKSWNRQGPHQESVLGYCLFGSQFGVTNGLTLRNSSDKFMLKPSPVFHHLQIAIPSNAEMSSSLCQLSWKELLLLGLFLVHHRPVDICAAFPSHSPVHHHPVDICAAFMSHSPVHLCPVDICAAFLSHSPVHHRPVDICAAFTSHSPVHLHPVDICAIFPSHSPIHLHPVDICAAFSSHSPVHHHPVDICAAFLSHSPMDSFMWIFAMTSTNTLITSCAFLSPDTQWHVVRKVVGKSLP